MHVQVKSRYHVESKQFIIIGFYLHFHSNSLGCSKQSYELDSVFSSTYRASEYPWIHWHQHPYSSDGEATSTLHLAEGVQ